MKAIGFAFLLSSLFIFQACTNERRVQAGAEETPSSDKSQTYAPLPPSPSRPTNRPIRGDLRLVDLSKNTFVVRMENGIEQTFRFNGETTVIGGPESSSIRQKPPKPVLNEQVAQLVGRDGSDVSVQWTQADPDKIATSVNVLQLTAAKKQTRRR
jgi:hypothetical protein